MTDVCDAGVRDGEIPEDWSRSRYGECLQRKERCLGMWFIQKLLEHAMKVLERVIEARVRKIVKLIACSLDLWQVGVRQMLF